MLFFLILVIYSTLYLRAETGSPEKIENGFSVVVSLVIIISEKLNIMMRKKGGEK